MIAPRTALITLMTLVAGSVDLVGEDVGSTWNQWRGPNRDGKSPETNLLNKWPEGGPGLVWKAAGLGSGYASVAVVNGTVYTLGTRQGGTHLIAINDADGTERWSAEVGNGGQPNGTPTIDTTTGLAYALNKRGDLVCIDTADGKRKWAVNFAKDFSGKMMSGWGYSESPLVDGDRLICSPGSNNAMLAALDKRTGKVVWQTKVPDMGKRGRDGAGYSSVVISNACGIKQYVQLTGRGLIGVAADDGRYLWHYERIANRTANFPTPIVRDDYVFGSTGYADGGSALLKLVAQGSGIEAQEVYYYKAKELQNHHGGMVRIGDYIYGGHGHNKGIPFAVEMKTGKILWQADDQIFRKIGSAAVAYADGRLYFRYQSGDVHLIEATPDAYKLVGSFKIPDTKKPSWPHPVINAGRLYLREQDMLYVYDIKQQ